MSALDSPASLAQASDSRAHCATRALHLEHVPTPLFPQPSNDYPALVL